MLSILFGFGIAVLFQIFVFPVFARRQLTERLAAALEESVALLYEAAENAQGAGQAAGQPQGGGGGGSSGAASAGGAAGGKASGGSLLSRVTWPFGKGAVKSKASAAAGSRTAALQRAQRKKAAGLDALLGPTAVVSLGLLRLLRPCSKWAHLCRLMLRRSESDPRAASRLLRLRTTACWLSRLPPHSRLPTPAPPRIPRSSSCCPARSASRPLPRWWMRQPQSAPQAST